MHSTINLPDAANINKNMTTTAAKRKSKVTLV